MTKAVLITAISAGLAFSVTAQARERPGETVDVKSLPAAVQQTINQEAAGGEVVQVKREDDPMADGTMKSSSEQAGKSGASKSIRTASS
jgi:hypothetical protein